MPTAVGLLLAAGAGSRMGRPKALVVDERGPWLTRGVATLLAGGCDRVVVVLGARAHEAEALLTADPRLLPGDSRTEAASGRDPRLLGSAVRVVVADDWADGLAASLRAGLRAATTDPDPQEARVALITLVDYPTLPASAVARLLSGGDAGPTAAATAGVLRQSVFDGRPGHPVVVGRDHWSALAASLSGDRGAGPYLRAHAAEQVDCADLWDGADVDSPA